ncbi:MAG: hydrogenase assembly protein HupF, partial [Thermoprotei archaeon]
MGRKLGLGKLNRKTLEELVLKHLPIAVAGLDSSQLPHVEDAVISVNPAIGVPTEALGFFAFHYAASNVAVSMAKPLHATFTLLLPPGFESEDLEVITREFGREAKRYGVSVVAGHTATYKGVEQPLAVTTVIGRRIRAPRKPV